MEGNSDEVKIVKLPHHQEQPLCETRAKYRQGKKLTAVKVYAVCDESRHLLLRNVTSVDVQDELAALCQRFGALDRFGPVDGYETERFTRVYHVKYHRIGAARFAKSQLDDRNFFGTHLKVCYAPELETLEETADKLHWRSIYYRTGLARCQRGGGSRARRQVGSARVGPPPAAVPGPSGGGEDAPAGDAETPLIGPVLPPAAERAAQTPAGGHRTEAQSEPTQAAPQAPKKRIVFKRKRPEASSGGVSQQSSQQGVTDGTLGKLQQIREQIQQAVLRSSEKRRRCDEPTCGS